MFTIEFHRLLLEILGVSDRSRFLFGRRGQKFSKKYVIHINKNISIMVRIFNYNKIMFEHTSRYEHQIK